MRLRIKPIAQLRNEGSEGVTIKFKIILDLMNKDSEEICLHSEDSCLLSSTKKLSDIHSLNACFHFSLSTLPLRSILEPTHESSTSFNHSFIFKKCNLHLNRTLLLNSVR